MENETFVQDIKENEMPVLLLQERPIFPESLTTMMVARPEDVRVMNEVIRNEGYFLALLQDGEGKEGCRRVGTVSKITKYIKLPNNCLHLFISTIKRARVVYLKEVPYGYKAKTEDIVDRFVSPKVLSPYIRILKDLVSGILPGDNIFSIGTHINIENFDDSSSLTWFTASALQNADRDFLQALLEEIDPKKRIDNLISYISNEKEINDKKNRVQSELMERVKNRNKEAILKEQIKELTDELNRINGFGPDNNYSFKKPDLYTRAREKELPSEFREAVDRELEKLSTLETMNPEYTLTKVYIETILNLPFSFEEKAPKYSVKGVRAKLEEDHYGMKEVKDRIVEFLASRLKAQDSKGAIICLAGPPGVGKTSVASSIAEALNRKFYRFSVGGMRDEAEIKGHRRTYVGALPGKIIQAMESTGVVDPVILIDEIDKMGSSYNGDPASALLEVLDPEQNKGFLDLYLDVPYDLSRVLFIVTANDTSTIPSPLFDRMEIIEMSGYTPNEKLHIGKEYLVPQLLKKNGMTKKEIKFSDKTLSAIAECYAREAGVRQFKNEIDKIMRKVCVKYFTDPEICLKLPISIKPTDLKEYLGLPPFPSDEIVSADSVGMAMGLAWTSAGGDVIPVEAVSIPEKGELKITGQLGDVMKESVAIAYSTLKHEAYKRGLDMSFFQNNSVHLHCPEGAVPKDGPSAGITLFSALWSMYREIPCKKDLAMTGELTLTGKVEPIGGLKEKILGARRNNIKEIIIPKQNLRDLEKLDDEIKGDVVFHTVSNLEEVIQIVFPEETSRVLTPEELKTIEEQNRKSEERKKAEENRKYAEAFKGVMQCQ